MIWEHQTLLYHDMSIQDVPYNASCVIVQVLTWTSFRLLFLTLLYTHTFQALDWQLQILAVSSVQVYHGITHALNIGHDLFMVHHEEQALLYCCKPTASRVTCRSVVMVKTTPFIHGSKQRRARAGKFVWRSRDFRYTGVTTVNKYLTAALLHQQFCAVSSQRRCDKDHMMSHAYINERVLHTFLH